MNILITGYTGFIGSNLAKELNSDNLYGVDIHQNDSVLKHYQWDTIHECIDLDCIIHLAGKVHDTGRTSSQKEYFEINVGLTQKIFQHFLKSKATKFIFFSSVKAVTDSVKGDILTEDAITEPKTLYGKSKLEAENYILHEFEKWSANEKTKGRHQKFKKVFILRPCMIHGPGNKGNLNLLYKIQLKGLPWPLGSFENKRSFCSIDNILFVVRQLIYKEIGSGIYQVADDDYLSTNQLLSLMALSLNNKIRIWNIPVKSIITIAIIGDFFNLPLNSERLKKLTESYLVSNQKIKQALGIEKMPVSAYNGLQKTFESFKKNI